MTRARLQWAALALTAVLSTLAVLLVACAPPAAAVALAETPTVDVPAWVTLAVLLLGFIGTLAAGTAVFSSQRTKAQVDLLAKTNQALEEALQFERAERSRDTQQYLGEIAALRAQVEVLRSELVAGLVESIRTAIVEAIREGFQQKEVA